MMTEMNQEPPSGPIHRLPGVLQVLEPGEIWVDGEIGRRMELTVRKNLLALDLEGDFLRHFQERVPYPWDPELKREFQKQGRMLFNGLGETLDALVLFAAYGRDQEILALKRRVVDAVIATQEADGYIGQFSVEPGNRQLPTDFAFEDGSYFSLALADDAFYFGDSRSLDAARRLVRCMVAADRERDDYDSRSFSGIGFAQAALVVYRITGEEEFLSIARHTRLGPARTSNVQSLFDWVDDPLFQKGWHDWRQQAEAPKKAPQAPPAPAKGEIDDGTSQAAQKEIRLLWHVYRNMERMYTQMQLHRIDGDERYLRMTRRLTAALFRTDHSGLAISGGIGRHEGWSEDQHCGDGLGETCASGVTLQFLQELMNTDADLRYGDAMERVLYNQLFAAQEPAGRRLRYFAPATGKRSYYPHDIFCCPGNYRRALSQMPRYLYYRFGQGIAVNLYNQSRAEIRLAGDLVVTMDQVTDYPSSGRINLTVAPSRPATFPIFLRVPRWCEEPRILVNGDVAEATIEREWHTGDRIVIDFPMRWRLVRGRDLQRGRASLMRGPTVFTLARAASGLAESVVLRDITLDPASIDGPHPDTTIRPDGQACMVRAWSAGRSTTLAPDLKLKLTEYPDPDGEEVFFLLPAGAQVEEDELATLAGSEPDEGKENSA
jgi:uncharacterized protein